MSSGSTRSPEAGALAALGWVIVSAAARGLTGLAGRGLAICLRCVMVCSIIEVGMRRHIGFLQAGLRPGA